MIFNVLDLGAKCDRTTNDAPIFQVAADYCLEAGGGTIIVPAGEYLVSSIRLYSNTTLRLEAGARLYLCADETAYGHLRGKYDEEYSRDECILLDLPKGTPLNFMQKMFLAGRRCHTDNMFYANNAENITIEGDGAICGQYEYFFNSEPGGEDGTYSALFSTDIPRWRRRLDMGCLLPKTFRPQFIYMQECKNIRLRDFNLLDCPFFNIRITDSEEVMCTNLNIETNKRCQNTDGINLSGCRNCFISGCRIVTGDDCIALSTGEMPPRKYNCENIVVENCIGSTFCNFFRIFIGIDVNVCYEEKIGTLEAIDVARTQTIRNINISNCILEEGGCIANLVAVFGTMENVNISNVINRKGGKDTAIFVAIQKEGIIRNVTFDGIKSLSQGAITVLGTTPESISRLTFRDCFFKIEPTSKLFGNGLPDPLIQYWISDLAPYNIYMRHARDVRLIDCEIEWGDADIGDIMEIADKSKRPDEYNAVWRDDMDPSASWPAIDAFDMHELELRNFRGTGFGGAEAIRAKDTTFYCEKA